MYQNSEQHKKNARIASKKGLDKIHDLHLDRIEEYNKNPKLCLMCGKSIVYEKKSSAKFCNSSCAAKYNNSRRIVTNEQKNKVSSSLKEKYDKGELVSSFSNPETRPLPKNQGIGYCKLKYTDCKICNKTFVQKSYGVKVTCSEKCRVIASVKLRPYQNGSRKTIWYFNKWQNKEVLLESSWEKQIAEFLDNKEIHWERPDPITWVDSKLKTRLYFPDFYLPKYNLYLDPKNPYCMNRDIEKMRKVSDVINVVYGDVKIILNKIKELI